MSSVALPLGGPIPYFKGQLQKIKAGFHADLFKRYNSLDERICLLQDLGARHRSHKKLRLATFENHDIPELRSCENWLSPRWIDWTCLRLVKDNHDEGQNTSIS